MMLVSRKFHVLTISLLALSGAAIVANPAGAKSVNDPAQIVVSAPSSDDGLSHASSPQLKEDDGDDEDDADFSDDVDTSDANDVFSTSASSSGSGSDNTPVGGAFTGGGGVATQTSDPATLWLLAGGIGAAAALTGAVARRRTVTTSCSVSDAD